MDIYTKEEKNNKLVSIIVSVYNGENYLRQTIDSLLAQTYKNLEIIIINDGSQDSSKQIILSYHDHRIVFLDRHENLGLTRSLNHGLSIAHGKYIARLDVGDISLRNRIEEQFNFLENNPEIAILGAGLLVFSHLRSIRKFIYAQDHNEIKSQLLHFFNPLPHSTLMMRREVIEQLGGYNNFFTLSQDYDFLLRASELFKMTSIQKPLIKLRFDLDSLSNINSEQLRFGLAALISAHRRLKGYTDHSKGNEKKWQCFLDNIETFIKKRGLDKKFMARKYLNSAFFQLVNFNLFLCFKGLFSAFKNDKFFFLRRGVGLRIPEDIEEFLI